MKKVFTRTVVQGIYDDTNSQWTSVHVVDGSWIEEIGGFDPKVYEPFCFGGRLEVVTDPDAEDISVEEFTDSETGEFVVRIIGPIVRDESLDEYSSYDDGDDDEGEEEEEEASRETSSDFQEALWASFDRD